MLTEILCVSKRIETELYQNVPEQVNSPPEVLSAVNRCVSLHGLACATTSIRAVRRLQYTVTILLYSM